MKTIAEIAKTINVSKTAVRKYMTAEFREKHTETRDGVIYIDENGESQLRSKVKTKSVSSSRDDLREYAQTVSETMETTDKPTENHTANDAIVAAYIATLERQLTEKDKQLSERDKQISELLQTVQAEQALHAGTQSRLLTDGKESSGGLWSKIFRKKE